MENRELSEREEKAAEAFAAEFGSDRAVYASLLSSERAAVTIRRWEEEEGADPRLHLDRVAILPALLFVEDQYRKTARQWHAVFRRVAGSDAERTVEYTEVRTPGKRAARDSQAGRPFLLSRICRQDLALATPIAPQNDARSINLAIGLSESFLQAEEISHANVLATGRSLNLARDIADPLFSAAHRSGACLYSNLLQPQMHLNEAALELAAQQIRKIVDANGHRLLLRPHLLVVPIELESTAHRLMRISKSDGQPPAFPSGYAVLDYLDAPKSWFLTTSIHGLVSCEWEPFSLNISIKDDELILEATQSYGAGYNNPRGCFASFPATNDPGR